MPSKLGMEYVGNKSKSYFNKVNHKDTKYTKKNSLYSINSCGPRAFVVQNGNRGTFVQGVLKAIPYSIFLIFHSSLSGIAGRP